MSFGELMQAARQQAAALRALGLVPGDRGRDLREVVRARLSGCPILLGDNHMEPFVVG